MSKLNLLKDKWFFKATSREECVAFQEWAFTQGLSWVGSGEVVNKSVFGDSIGGNNLKGGSLGHASAMWYEDRGFIQIFPKFKTVSVVDCVDLPEVESRQEKKIRELEATIAKAQEQIQALKKEI